MVGRLVIWKVGFGGGGDCGGGGSRLQGKW